MLLVLMLFSPAVLNASVGPTQAPWQSLMIAIFCASYWFYTLASKLIKPIKSFFKFIGSASFKNNRRADALN